MTELPDDYKEMLQSMAEDLNGELHYFSTLDHSGRTSKKVVLEYDINTK
jgi:hypothetical protein|tara:strand:- start:1360 stop:1506 length:147 start_codon:yes stop_codon:yes gene_type:complete